MRRLGSDPRTLDVSLSNTTCPEIWEAENGDIVVVGTDITEVQREELPSDLKVAPYERMIVIPRITMESAMQTMAALAPALALDSEQERIR